MSRDECLQAERNAQFNDRYRVRHTSRLSARLLFSLELSAKVRRLLSMALVFFPATSSHRPAFSTGPGRDTRKNRTAARQAVRSRKKKFSLSPPLFSFYSFFLSFVLAFIFFSQLPRVRSRRLNSIFFFVEKFGRPFYLLKCYFIGFKLEHAS